MIVKTTDVCERLGGCKIVKTKTPFFPLGRNLTTYYTDQ